MKILLFGKNGQLGRELQRVLGQLGSMISFGRMDIDFRDLARLTRCVLDEQPDIIVNAAAYTLVDAAESADGGKIASAINTDAVGVIAAAAKTVGALFIHYSTDYVFDGNKEDSAYLEEDQANPINVYGRTKSAGENLIRDVSGEHIIIRSSWLYSLYRNTFPLIILEKALSGHDIDVVVDSVGAPTSVRLLADVTLLAIYRSVTDASFRRNIVGTYHVAACGSVSWYEYARTVLVIAKQNGLPVLTTAESIRPIVRAFSHRAAMRPKSSLLDSGKIENVLGIKMAPWSQDVALLVSDISRGYALSAYAAPSFDELRR